MSDSRGANNQLAERKQIRRSLTATVLEHGYPETTIEEVARRADLDQAAFGRHYSDIEECFQDVWNACKDDLVERTSSAFRSADRWRDGMRAAAWAFCRWIDEDQARAQLFLVEMIFASEMLRATRDFVMETYIDFIDQGNSERPNNLPAVPRAQAEALMGGIWEGAASLTKSKEFDELPSLMPQAMYLTVFPYLGLEAAEEELRRGPQDIARYERRES